MVSPTYFSFYSPLERDGDVGVSWMQQTLFEMLFEMLTRSTQVALEIFI
jgi:hypothetical protein